MAYIGKEPLAGNFVKLDAITTSATETYALTRSSVAFKPANAESTAIGACKVAMLSSGMSIENLSKNEISFKANKDRKDVYFRNYSKWQEYLLNTIK